MAGTLSIGNSSFIQPQWGPLSLRYKSGPDSWATGLTIQDTTGNVGIGTTAPGQKLSVAGTVESTTGGFKFPDATTQTTQAGLTKIQQIVLSADGTIDFTSIPATYENLRIVARLRGKQAATTEYLYMKVNNDGGTNYDWATTWQSSGGLGTDEGFSVATSTIYRFLTADSAPANFFDTVTIDIAGYARTDTYKQAMAYSAGITAESAANIRINLGALYWKSTVAINRLTLYGATSSQLKAGSVATLYGYN